MKRPALLILGMAGLSVLAGCLPLPTNDQAAPPAASDFTPIGTGTNQPGGEAGPGTPGTPSTPSDPFAAPQDIGTATVFKPQLTMQIPSLKAGDYPAVTISVYQTKAELEVKETRTLLENASFQFDQLKVDQVIGTGKLEVGTPPKLTFDIQVKVASTDNKESVQLTVKGENAIARVYVADMQIKKVPEGLSIVSIGNLSRANDKRNIHTTEASARLTQTLSAGFLRLPETAGPMRSTTVLVAETDPANQVNGQKVFRETFQIQ